MRRPTTDGKLEAIEKMTKPKNKRDIQVFLGMIGYYQKFIPDFTQQFRPLFNLLKGNLHFLWTEGCTKAFKLLKMKLMTAPILMYPDFSKQFIVQTDASLTAVGGVLSQINDLGEEHPVAYCSRTLNPAERNYTVTERECLAVIYSYQQFRVYLHGTKFKVVTDNSSLQWLKTLKEPEGRLARWVIKLQAYNYTIEHRAGSKHQNADGLSRLPTIHTLIPEADRLYELIHQPKKWDNEILEIKQILGKLSENTTYNKGQLFKELGEKILHLLKTIQ